MNKLQNFRTVLISTFLILAGQCWQVAQALDARSNTTRHIPVILPHRTIPNSTPNSGSGPNAGRGGAVADKVKDVKALHRTSITTSTLHIYTKIQDIKGDGILRSLLKSAVGADSPDDTPEVEQKAAASLNLHVNEHMSAHLIRESKFDPQLVSRAGQANVVLGEKSHDNVFHLTSGNALFVPKNNIVVATEQGEISIGAGSIVCVMKPSPGVVSVYDLHDGKDSGVVVKSGNETLNLLPGNHIVLSEKADEFEKVSPAHHIAYRKLAQRDLQSGTKVYSTEFSIPSAILHIQPLQKMLLSENKEDRQTADRLIKDFVILQDLSGGDEPYKMPGLGPAKISENLD